MPVRAMEYVAAKVLSLCMISMAVAAVLAAAADTGRVSVVLAGTAVSSVIFTLLGIIVSTKISSLNQFILWIMPIELITFLPAVLHILGITSEILQFYPAIICMNMIDGHIAISSGSTDPCTYGRGTRVCGAQLCTENVGKFMRCGL